jgi:hypothetical protein
VRIIKKIVWIAVAVVLLCAAWLFGARQLTLLADRFSTVRTETIALSELVYVSEATAGLIVIRDGIVLATDSDLMGAPVEFQPGGNKQMIISAGRKSFVLGPLASSLKETQFGPAARATLEPNDTAALLAEHSRGSWPSFLDFNFMTGNSPSWKRNIYRRLVWKKASGATLEMLWRYEQYYYSSNGWTDGWMTRGGVTGLVSVEIRP